MSKVSKQFFYLAIFVILQLFWLNIPIYAADLQPCPNPNVTVIPDTHPGPLIGTDRKAVFEVYLDSSLYSGWLMEFDCGGKNKGDQSDVEIDNGKISRELVKPGGGSPCEFDEGSHGIKVIGVNNLGDETPYCLAKYTSSSALVYEESKCQIDINPKDQITTDSKLTASASGLPARNPYNYNDVLKYRIYIDKSPIATSPFSEKTEIEIPTRFITPGKPHSVYIRRNSDNYILPACKATYTVGTKDRPGNVVIINKDKPITPCRDPKTCSSGAGDPCTTDLKNPGFKTAIGCIHTNPAEFAKDLLKFGIGIGGGLAFLMMLLGAFQMLTSGGNPETLAAGQGRLTSAVIGLLFIIFSVLLLQIIGTDILNLEGFK